MIRYLFLFSVLLSNAFFSQTQLNLIPYPQNVKLNQGNFTISDVLILSNKLPKEETDYFKKKVGADIKFQYSGKSDAQLVYFKML